MKFLLAIVLFVLANAAIAKNHIAFVNVDNAVDDQLFYSVVITNVAATSMANVVVDRAKMIRVEELVGLASKGYPNGERKISIYFINTTALPPRIVCPGYFAVINVRGLNNDADAEKYRERIKKMGLKGLALACGFGANQDIGRCVMSVGSFDTLKGIDSTSASYSPFCFFPLQDYLQSRGLLNTDE